MITAREISRRMIMFTEATWEAREKIVDLIERQTDRKELDWFERERFDEETEFDRRVHIAREQLNLHDAYNADSVHVKCTPEERSGMLRLAFDVLEGRITPERGVDRLFSEDFLHDVSAESTIGG